MALNPIVDTEKVVRSFLCYQPDSEDAGLHAESPGRLNALSVTPMLPALNPTSFRTMNSLDAKSF
jgi:hypothetical protein